MGLIRSVTANLVERFIFNFRLRPDSLERHLPAEWLKPQVMNGWSIVSFCVLKLEKCRLSWLPSFLGRNTISCAYRIGVMDNSGIKPEPSVYITDRNTDLPIICRLGPFIFFDSFPMIRLKIDDRAESYSIQARFLDKQRLFSATARLSKDQQKLNSKVFDSIAAYSKFIHDGVSSYAPSIFGDQLVKIDLYKEDPNYQPLDAEVDVSWLDGVWADAGMEFDCAVRATGGKYKWNYRGLRTYVKEVW